MSLWRICVSKFQLIIYWLLSHSLYCHKDNITVRFPLKLFSYKYEIVTEMKRVNLQQAIAKLLRLLTGTVRKLNTGSAVIQALFTVSLRDFEATEYFSYPSG